MRKLPVLLIVLLTSLNGHAVHECGSPHLAISSNGHADQGCENLKETDFFYGDPRGDAPELSVRGRHNVGVRTLQLVNLNQLDILSYSEQQTNPRYDRKLTIEVWYPAKLQADQKQIT
ncbi:MAG: hypothetical protein ACKJRM_08905, partial [Porticoccaceae bacterium]